MLNMGGLNRPFFLRRWLISPNLVDCSVAINRALPIAEADASWRNITIALIDPARFSSGNDCLRQLQSPVIDFMVIRASGHTIALGPLWSC